MSQIDTNQTSETLDENEKLYQELMSLVKTHYDAQTFFKELDLLERAYYSTDKDAFESVLNEKVRFDVANVLQNYLKQASFVDDRFFTELRYQLKELRPLRLTLGFKPNKGILDRIATWVKTNVGTNVVIMLHYDTNLVGGVQIEFEGRYGDFSLRGKINDLFELSRKEANQARRQESQEAPDT